MDTWRLITTLGADPGFNMGLDEALLEDELAPPTLRLYTWEPDTLSLGYFQRFAEVPAASGIDGRKPGALVRRITGGGAIHHVHELTFSLVAPATQRLYQGPIAESYKRVHAAIAAALAELGIAAELRGERALDSDVPATGMCFHHSSALDLVWGAKKGVGSAQRRTRGRVLHHGSIKLESSVFEGSIATVRESARRIQAGEFAPLLRAAFERVLEIRLVTGIPEAHERSRARRLGLRYLDPDFVRRR
jgi:lipoate-protein ligase A